MLVTLARSLVTDHLGSVRFVVNLASGNVSQKITYDEYGNVHTNTGKDLTPFFFAGGLYEEATGLTRFGARDYDANTGRWTAKDPILFAGGTSNLYEYCLNDPVNSVDLDGLQFTNITNFVNQTIFYFNIKLNKARQISNEVIKEAQERAKTLPGGQKGLRNGVADAWRHARWNQRMVNEIDAFTAFLAGWGHEIVDNLFKGAPLDELFMDIYNNAKGRTGVHPDILLENNALMIIDGPGINNPYEGDKRCGIIK